MTTWVHCFWASFLLFGRVAVGADLPPSQTDILWNAVRQAKSVDEAVPLLKEAFPRHFINYTLVYSSRSLQRATPMEPRVLLYGENARFIFTYNNLSDANGHETLEVMEYMGGSHFSLSEVVFDGKKAVFESNPSKCESCHGYPTRPRWDQYFLWPGVYGSEDDHLTYALTQEKGVEQKWFEEFDESRQLKPRYAALAPLGSGYAGGRSSYFGRPNASLSELLNELNAKSIAKEIVSISELHPWRFLMLAVFTGTYGCEILHYFPPSLRPELQELITRLEDEVLRSKGFALKDKLHRHRKLVGEAVGRASGYGENPQGSDYDLKHWAWLRFVLEGMQRVDPWQWSLERVPGWSLDINGGLSELEKAIREEFEKIEPLPEYDYFTGCRKLKESHLALFPLDSESTLGQLRGLMKTFTHPSVNLPFSKCVDCHRNRVGTEAPVIPFGSAGFLSRSLRGSPFLGQKIENRIREIPEGGLQRMPPKGPALSPSERGAILKFLKESGK